MLLVARPDPLRRDLLYRSFVYVHQRNVWFVERLKIVGVQRLAFRAVGVGLGDQFFGGHRVLYRLTNPLAQELGADVVRVFVEKHVLVVGQPEAEAAIVPAFPELTLALLWRYLKDGLFDEG